MKNKNVYIAAGVLVVILVIIFAVKNSNPAPSNETGDETGKTTEKSSVTSQTPTKAAQTTQKSGATNTFTSSSAALNLPKIDFINKSISFSPKDFPDVKITVEKVAFGRGESIVSPGCSGVPNADFTTYLYPGSNICLGDSKVDGSPAGILALHLTVENNGNIGFGGNSEFMKLHYMRADSSGKLLNKFADTLAGLGGHYIQGYSSKSIVLSFMVPENQLVYDFVVGYKEPLVGSNAASVYDTSTNGIFIDFGSKSIKIVK